MDEIFCISNRVLYSEQSGMDFIEVCEDLDYRWIHFGDNYTQSAMSLKHPERLVLPYMQAMMLSLFFRKDISTVLILGLGAGSLVRFIRHYDPAIQQIAVDLNSSVVNIAREYFQLPGESQDFHIHVADAHEFVAPERDPADCIYVDVFHDGTMPESVRSEAFFVHCKRLLRKDGVFVLNLLLSREEDIKDVLQDLIKVFDGRVLALDVKDYRNIIVFAFNNNPKNISYKKAQARAKKLQQRTEIDFPNLLETLFSQNLKTANQLTDETELAELFAVPIVD